MIELINKYDCSGCAACESACPQNCISMCRDDEGFLYPKVDLINCVDCGICEDVCPCKFLKKENRELPRAYAAINKDEAVRAQSSSGGLFTLVAEYVLEHNGVVFGAAFDELFNVIHISAETKDELKRIRGSKYVQSQIGSSYVEAKRFLDQGRLVLFTGTPCQIAGLYSFIKKDYENLISQDIICHGVPSPMVWEKYMDYRKETANDEIDKVMFRYKKYGWKNFFVQFKFKSGKIYEQSFLNDLFMRAFSSNLCLRPSCYSCHFKTLNRKSDITLADFWGVDSVCEGMNDDKGTSLILIHSERGQKLFDCISDKLVAKQVDVKESVRENTAAIESVRHPDQRASFMCDVKSKKIKRAVLKYCRVPLSKRMKRIIIKCKRKLKQLFD